MFNIFPCDLFIIINTTYNASYRDNTSCYQKNNDQSFTRIRDTSYLLKRGTTWNQLKPSKNTQRLLETTWNQPYHSNFLLKISYSQFEFVLILSPKVFFGQIWSQKLKFSRLAKIWCRGILPYPYFDFNVYFSKIFVIHIFWGKFGPKIWSFPNKLKFDTGVHCYMLIAILMFSFSKFCHLYNFGQIWAKSNWLKFDTKAHCYMLIMVLMWNFSKYLPFENFWGKFHPKICCSPYLLKFSIEIQCNFINMEKTGWNKICL